MYMAPEVTDSPRCTSADGGLHLTPADAGLHLTPADAGLHLTSADAGLHLTPADAGLHLTPADAGLHLTPADAGLHSRRPMPGFTSRRPMPGFTSRRPMPGVSLADQMTPAARCAIQPSATQVLRGEGQHTAADVWALGCTVIEMLAGQACARARACLCVLALWHLAVCLFA
jgi:serine/threonine protein kinase